MVADARHVDAVPAQLGTSGGSSEVGSSSMAALVHAAMQQEGSRCTGSTLPGGGHVKVNTGGSATSHAWLMAWWSSAAALCSPASMRPKLEVSLLPFAAWLCCSTGPCACRKAFSP